MRKVTLKDVAALVGVSEMTASRALRQHRDVSETTRLKVLEAVKALGYVPNRAASMLSSRSSRIIPMIVPSLRNTVFLDVIAGAQEVIDGQGYQMMLLNSQYSPEKEMEAVSTVLAWSPAALILSGVDHAPGTHELLRGVDFPVIETMDIADDAIDICVGFSHYRAGSDMAHYMLGKGYRSFAFCGSRMEADIRGMKRYRGFRRALAEKGLGEPKFLDLEHRFEDLARGRGFEEILEECGGLDCIYFSNDDLAVGALLTCRRLGIDVPDRIALAGFNDLAVGRLTVPGLTTSRAPRYEIGLAAARCAMDGIEGREIESRTIDLGCELVPRESA